MLSVLFLMEASDTNREETSRTEHLFAEAGKALREAGVEATLKVTGEEARRWRSSDPLGMIDLLKFHDLAFSPPAPLISPGGAIGAASSDAGPLASGKVTAGTGVAEHVGQANWTKGAEIFFQKTVADYRDVVFAAGKIPSSYASESWAPQQYWALDQWGIRVELSRQSFIDSDGAPFFYGGRLNLSNLGPNWIDASSSLANAGGVEELFSTLSIRARAMEGDGIVCLSIPFEKLASMDHERFLGDLRQFVRMLEKNPSISLESARQIADRHADISYEHRIPMEQLKAIAAHARTGVLEPFSYAAGFLSPSEQLYLLASAWDETRRKGKLVRNSTTRTPLGPAELAETDPGVKGVLADKLPEVLSKLTAFMQQEGRLPAKVEVDGAGGGIAVQDLLPTLAGCFDESLASIDIILKKGVLDTRRVRPELAKKVWASGMHSPFFSAPRQLDMAKLQLWTYKPVVGLSRAPGSTGKT